MRLLVRGLMLSTRRKHNGSLTIGISIHDNHASEFRHTQTCDFIPFLCPFSLCKNTPLNYTIDTFIEKRHCGCGLNNTYQRPK
ncbi:hypothetical protein TMatcc_005879 [Talaromyces marneffei ATCC 18224]